MASDKPPEDTKKVRSFQPRVLDKTVIALPLLRDLEAEDKAREEAKGTKPPFAVYEVIIDLHLDYPGGRPKARDIAVTLIEKAKKNAGTAEGEVETDHKQYLFDQGHGDVSRFRATAGIIEVKIDDDL